MARQKNTEMRQKILSTALRMFYEKGNSAVLMKKIADECGIGISLLNHYFRKKEDILVHIFYDIVYRLHTFITTELFPKHIKNEGDSIAFYGLVYHLFYNLLCRDSNRLLQLYTTILYDAQLLNRAVAFSLLLTPPEYRIANTRERALATYMLNGSLSQAVVVYLNGIPPENMDVLLTGLLHSYYGSVGISKDEQARIEWLIDTILTEEVFERCYQHCILDRSDFIECTW